MKKLRKESASQTKGGGHSPGPSPEECYAAVEDEAGAICAAGTWQPVERPVPQIWGATERVSNSPHSRHFPQPGPSF